MRMNLCCVFDTFFRLFCKLIFPVLPKAIFMANIIVEGKFYIYNRSGRLEKVVDAHKGATLCARWSYDGSSLLTCKSIICVQYL